jgi:hypothetical protein
MKDEHSAAFQELRDTILALGQDDRRQLAALTGAMHATQPPISGPLAEVLGKISRLDVNDRARLARWCGCYVSRWGQIPVAASRGVSAAGGVVRSAPPKSDERMSRDEASGPLD